MSVDWIVTWIFIAAWFIVAGLVLLRGLPRIVREGSRIVRRTLALIDQSGLSRQFVKAEADLKRLRAAVTQLTALRRRASKAAGRLRSAPRIPPSVALVASRVERELRRFRQAASR